MAGKDACQHQLRYTLSLFALGQFAKKSFHGIYNCITIVFGSPGYTLFDGSDEFVFTRP
jgi:hypothetical protein